MFSQSKKQERVQTKAHKTKYSALEIIRLNYIQGPKKLYSLQYPGLFEKIYIKCLYELKHTFSRFRTLHFNNLRQMPPRLPDYSFTKQITCCSFTWVFHINMYLS